MTVDDDFAMSSKIFASEYGEHHHDLVSFTTICPGRGPGKDAYWVIEDVCKHVVEVSHIFKWVHRVTEFAPHPKMFVIFDGSSNHKARSEDALHVGDGVCKRPGGKNAPGARKTKRFPEGVPKMRDGWYMDAHGNKIVQHMHRQKTWMDDQGCIHWNEMPFPFHYVNSWSRRGNAIGTYQVVNPALSLTLKHTHFLTILLTLTKLQSTKWWTKLTNSSSLREQSWKKDVNAPILTIAN